MYTHVNICIYKLYIYIHIHVHIHIYYAVTVDCGIRLALAAFLLLSAFISTAGLNGRFSPPGVYSPRTPALLI